MDNLLKHTCIYPFVCFLFLFASGCIHEFPDENAVDPRAIDPYWIDLNISLSIDMKMDSDTLFQTYATMLEDDYDIRYIIDIYEMDETRNDLIGNRVKRIVKTENNIISNGVYHLEDTIKLPVYKYRIIAWMDFVEKGTAIDKYYNTADLQNIAILAQPDGYQGYNTTKDAFTAKVDMDLTPYKEQRFVHYEALLEVKRPFAVYQIITTDIEEYITYHQMRSYSSIQPSKTTVLYNLFFPMGYNAYQNAPDNFQAGIHYPYDIVEVLPEKEALIASDLVFVEDDTFYMVDFEVFSAENTHINTVSGLRINLKRNHLTIIRAEFLTKDVDNGNVGIDDGFEDEIIIRL
jgi:hypothetical protein